MPGLLCERLEETMGEQLSFQLDDKKGKVFKQIHLICPVCKSRLIKPIGNWHSVNCPGCGTRIGLDGEL
jgi:hypothetical protein